MELRTQQTAIGQTFIQTRNIAYTSLEKIKSTYYRKLLLPGYLPFTNA